jgi:hypothetical protein
VQHATSACNVQDAVHNVRTHWRATQVFRHLLQNESLGFHGEWSPLPSNSVRPLCPAL